VCTLFCLLYCLLCFGCSKRLYVEMIVWLKDTVWWVFQNAWQPNPGDQQKLFSRIAQNFMHLLSSVRHPHFQETFIKVVSGENLQEIYHA